MKHLTFSAPHRPLFFQSQATTLSEQNIFFQSRAHCLNGVFSRDIGFQQTIFSVTARQFSAK